MAESSETRTKGMCIATRCTSVEEFVAMFHRFVDEESFFIATRDMREPGLETAFSIQLADKTPVLRGLCVVLQAWPTAVNPFRHPGLRLGIRQLTASSMHVFEQLVVTRSGGQPTVIQDLAKTLVSPRPVSLAPPARDEVRTPGSELILPANPLMNLSDESLEGYVDCTLYEETANFFPAAEDLEEPEDPLVPPPVFAPLPVIARATTSPAALEPAPPPLVSPPNSAPPAPDAAPHDVVPPTSAAPPVPPLKAPKPPPLPPSVRPPPVPKAAIAETPERLDSSPALVAAEALPVVRPPRARPPMWLLGVAGAVVATAVAIPFVASSDDSPRLASSPTTSPPTVAAREPERAARPLITAARTEPEDAASEPALVGEGPCRIAVVTTPAGSIVQLDGRTLGPSPLTLAATCERHRIDIAHPRYQPTTRWVTPEADKPQSLDVSLQRPTHAVTISSYPPGADVYIDDRRAGTTPTVVQVLGFTTVKFRIEKRRFRPETQRFYSKVPQDRLSVVLAK